MVMLTVFFKVLSMSAYALLPDSATIRDCPRLPITTIGSYRLTPRSPTVRAYSRRCRRDV